jgi:hypothetical protein
MAEIWSDAQAAWAEYVAKNYFSADCIETVRRGFLAGWDAARERDAKNREREDRRRY